MGQDLMPDCPEELRSTPGLLPDNSGYKIKVKVKEKVKVKYLETVFLTTDQYKSLVDKYGEQITGELIELLDAYKVSNGKKYKDDMGAIRSWVIKRWSTDHGRELKPMTDRERLKAKIIADEKRT
jgi:hypothetical protein